MKFQIGADPEIFVGDNESVRSIIGKVGGTKQHPLPLPIGEGFAVQEDNVALEFNIPACDSKAAFVSALTKATGFLEQAMKDMHGLHFVKASAVSFPEEEMYDERAFEFGCEPDFNAWTLQKNPRPEAKDKFLRSCGGHVHIGFRGLDPIQVVKACDLFLGVPSVLMDKGELRKQLYGKAGAFRGKPYGVEYRPLSNFWIFSPQTIGWVYDNVRRALDAVADGRKFDDYKVSILEAIDNNNKDLAQQMVKDLSLQVL